MKKSVSLILSVAGVLLLSAAFAQDEEAAENDAPRNDQADVWSVVEAQWDAEAEGKKNWHDDFLTDDFSGWSRNAPAPRSKASTMMWDRYTDSQGRLEEHELYPLAIIVHGDTAVAHYLYASAYEDKDGESEISSGRYTDVLVRTDDGWKFIAWHGGDEE